MDLHVELPKHKIGTTFLLGGKHKREATVTGYHIEHDTDTGQTLAQYRATYKLAGQTMTATVPRATLDRQLTNN